MHVIVLGAGVIGVSTAYFLARAGHSVEVLEQAAEAATGCSFANGGQLSYSYAEPLAAPGLPGKLPGLLRGDHPPLRIDPAQWPRLLPWGLRLLRNCTAARFAANTAKVLRLALYSRQVLQDLRAELALDFAYREDGKLLVYADPRDLAQAARLAAFKNRFGCAQEVWDAAQCVAREPALAALVGDLAGGVFSPLDASGDAWRFSRALAAADTPGGEVRYRYRTPVLALTARAGRVTGVESARGRFHGDAYVLCLGADSPRLARTLGLKLPIQPVKGYSLTLPAGPGAPRMSVTDTRHKLVYCTLDGELRVAGAMRFSGQDSGLDGPRLRHMLDTAARSFPAGGAYQQVTRRWAGLRPMTPDGAPLLGPSPYPNLFLNTGHGMLGWTLACGSAAALADLIGGQAPRVDLAGLELARF